MYPPAKIEHQIPALFEPLPSPRKLLLGVPRHTLELLDEAGLIRIIRAHMPGRTRPIVLVHTPSPIAYLEHEEELAKAQRKGEIRKGYPIPEEVAQ
jgi:hypothetical protein